ncbi:unnamed protein product [Linum tenue]|uniref:Uncharacterized protein n=1 Tax=Linum tenue TaxID=586396 RepID=A0AAV0Q7A6_9ROSI|nr:unnamed protein product [Linum tenue]
MWVLHMVGFHNPKNPHGFLPPFLNFSFFNTILPHSIIMASHHTSTSFSIALKLDLIRNGFDFFT